MLTLSPFNSVFCSTTTTADATVWGLPDLASASRVAELLVAERLSTALPELPETQWALVSRCPDGHIRATASTLLQSGLFWSVEPTPAGMRLLVATSPGALIRTRSAATELDADYLKRFTLLDVPPDRTPYLGVGRVPPGVVAAWNHPLGSPRLDTWSGPGLWPTEPQLEGQQALAKYVASFDAAVSQLVGSSAPIAAFLSGGLDSSFVVASAARVAASPQRPVHAFVHAPHPDAQLKPQGKWDPDESYSAAALERAYPGRVVVHRVVNDGLVAPLDAALEAAQRSWIPTFNPGNQVWISRIQELAAELGSAAVLAGDNGNAAFSHEPTYAVAYYLRRRDMKALRSLFPRDTADGITRSRAALSRFLGPSRAKLVSLLRPDSRQAEYLRIIGIPSTGPVRGQFGREQYLEWLAGLSGSHAASLCPVDGVVPALDPFTAASVMAVAASLSPREWCTGPYPRGFARRAGAGRVPDEIRLRTRRGGQAMDSWFAIRNLQDRYFDEVHLLDATPVIDQWVDARAVWQTVSAWPWGETQGPPQLQLIAVDRLLSLAAFIRMTKDRLQRYPQQGM
jgi:hypothetical protein